MYNKDKTKMKDPSPYNINRWRNPQSYQDSFRIETIKGREEKADLFNKVNLNKNTELESTKKVANLDHFNYSNKLAAECSDICCKALTSHIEQFEISNKLLPKICPCNSHSNKRLDVNPFSILPGIKERSSLIIWPNQLDIIHQNLFKKTGTDCIQIPDLNIAAQIDEVLLPLPELANAVFHADKQQPAIVPDIEEFERIMRNQMIKASAIPADLTNLSIANLSPSPTPSFCSPHEESTNLMITECLAEMEKMSEKDSCKATVLKPSVLSSSTSDLPIDIDTSNKNVSSDTVQVHSLGGMSFQSLLHNFHPSDFDLITNSLQEPPNLGQETETIINSSRNTASIDDISSLILNDTQKISPFNYSTVSTDHIIGSEAFGEIEFETSVVKPRKSLENIPADTTKYENAMHLAGGIGNIINYSKNTHVSKQAVCCDGIFETKNDYRVHSEHFCQSLAESQYENNVPIGNKSIEFKPYPSPIPDNNEAQNSVERTKDSHQVLPDRNKAAALNRLYCKGKLKNSNKLKALKSTRIKKKKLITVGYNDRIDNSQTNKKLIDKKRIINVEDNDKHKRKHVSDSHEKCTKLNKSGEVYDNDGNFTVDKLLSSEKIGNNDVLRNKYFPDQTITESEFEDVDTHLPLKKRKLSIANCKDEEEEDDDLLEPTLTDIIKRARSENTYKEDISYPAGRMISIAEVEEKLRQQRQFRTPAEKKEMPGTPPVYPSENMTPKTENLQPNMENLPPTSENIPSFNNMYEVPKIVTEQYNNHTYNNPTINYHMNNLPSCFFPCASLPYFPPIILPMSGTATFDMNMVNKKTPTSNRQPTETSSRTKRRKKGPADRVKTDEN